MPKQLFIGGTSKLLHVTHDEEIIKDAGGRPMPINQLPTREQIDIILDSGTDMIIHEDADVSTDDPAFPGY